MFRKVLRKEAVLLATGWALSTLYKKIANGKFPSGTKLDPDSRSVVWFEEQVEALQDAACKATVKPCSKRVPLSSRSNSKTNGVSHV